MVDLEKGKQALVTEHSNADGEGGSNRIYVFDVDEKKRLKSNLVLAFEDSFVWSEHPYFEFVRHKDRYETIKYHSDKLDEKQRKKESFSLHYDPKTKKFNKKLLETTKTNR